MELQAITSAASLTGSRGVEGSRIRDELYRAFDNHEYAISLSETYNKVNQRAVALMAEEIKEQTPHTPPPTPPTKEAPPASTRPKTNRSQIKGDALPQGIADAHLDIVFSYVEVACNGTKKPLWVSKNLEAMIRADGAASYDEATGMLTLSNLNWEGALDAE